MDRNKIVSIATSILIKKSINLQDIILLLDSYCTEKGKERLSCILKHFPNYQYK